MPTAAKLPDHRTSSIWEPRGDRRWPGADGV